MIDAAIVGLGRWGRNLVTSVQGKSDRLRFIRGVVRHPDAVRDFAAQHDFEVSADFSGMLADPRVQAVVLATPHSLHVEQIVTAANAMMHCALNWKRSPRQSRGAPHIPSPRHR